MLSKMSMKKLSLVIVSFIVLVVGCRKNSDQSDKTPPVVVDVKVSQLRVGALDETVTASGSTASLKETELRAPIAGVITRFQFFNGDAIKQGDTVAIIRTKESQASIQGAERMLRTAVTPAQKEEAKHALSLAQDAVSNAIIAAPYSGVLSGKIKNENELVAEGETFASLIDPASIVFIADVPSRSLSQIKKLQQARIHFPSMNDRVFLGVVNRIDPQLNQADQTAHIQINFSSSPFGLGRALFGDATIITGRRSNVLLAPLAALLHDDENNTTAVMVVGKDSVAHKINVEVGARQDSLVQVNANGISAGTTVIVQGHYGLPDSTRVRIVQ